MCKQFEQDLKSEKIRYATQEEVEQYNNNEEIKLILTKLKLVSEIEESGAYICDKEHSKLLLDYITNLQEELKYQEKAEQEYNEKHIKLMKKYKDSQEINEKVREFIIEKCIISDVWEEQKFNKFIPIGYIKYKPLSSKNTEKLYNILGGDDNAINSK